MFPCVAEVYLVCRTENKRNGASYRWASCDRRLQCGCNAGCCPGWMSWRSQRWLPWNRPRYPRTDPRLGRKKRNDCLNKNNKFAWNIFSYIQELTSTQSVCFIAPPSTEGSAFSAGPEQNSKYLKTDSWKHSSVRKQWSKNISDIISWKKCLNKVLKNHLIGPQCLFCGFKELNINWNTGRLSLGTFMWKMKTVWSS